MEQLSPYELERLERIKSNQQRLAELGIFEARQAVIEHQKAASAKVRVGGKPRDSVNRRLTVETQRETIITRSSRRLQGSVPECQRLDNDVDVEALEDLMDRAGGKRKLTHVNDSAAQNVLQGRCNSLGRGSIYDSVAGITCHFCRQKKLCGELDCPRCQSRNVAHACIGKTDCSKCQSPLGRFCRACLLIRYGLELEDVRKMMQDGNWLCPHCYEAEHPEEGWMCNSSICMKNRGLKPTGIAIYEAQEKGFKSVAHYLQAQILKRTNHSITPAVCSKPEHHTAEGHIVGPSEPEAEAPASPSVAAPPTPGTLTPNGPYSTRTPAVLYSTRAVTNLDSPHLKNRTVKDDENPASLKNTTEKDVDHFASLPPQTEHTRTLQFRSHSSASGPQDSPQMDDSNTTSLPLKMDESNVASPAPKEAPRAAFNATPACKPNLLRSPFARQGDLPCRITRSVAAARHSTPAESPISSGIEPTSSPRTPDLPTPSASFGRGRQQRRNKRSRPDTPQSSQENQVSPGSTLARAHSSLGFEDREILGESRQHNLEGAQDASQLLTCSSVRSQSQAGPSRRTSSPHAARSMQLDVTVTPSRRTSSPRAARSMQLDATVTRRRAPAAAAGRASTSAAAGDADADQEVELVGDDDVIDTVDDTEHVNAVDLVNDGDDADHDHAAESDGESIGAEASGADGRIKSRRAGVRRQGGIHAQQANSNATANVGQGTVTNMGTPSNMGTAANMAGEATSPIRAATRRQSINSNQNCGITLRSSKRLKRL